MIKAALKDSLIYGLASVLSRGLAIFLLPLYTRVLSPSDYGAYDLLITIGALANLVVAMEVSQGLARHLADTHDVAERRALMSTTLWFSVLMYGLFLLGGLIAAASLTQLLLGDEKYIPVFRLGLGYIAANGIYNLLLNQFRWELRSKAYALVNFGSALMTLLFTAWLGFVLQMGLSGVMLAQLLAQLLATLLGFWLLRQGFGFIFSFTRLRVMLRFSLPLVPAGLAVFISLYINRFALKEFASLEEVGLFGIASRIAGLSVLLIMGIQAALTPLVYQHYREPETPRQIARLFSWFLALALPVCLFLALFAHEMLALLTTTAFLGGAPLVAILAPALLLSQMYVFAPGIAIHKRTVWQLWVTLISALMSMIANWLFVPLYGGIGAAIATLMSALVFFGLWVGISQRLYPIPFAWRRIIVGGAVFMGCALLGSRLDNGVFTIWTVLLLKCLLLALMCGTVIRSGLLPTSDLLNLVGKVRQRLARAS